MHDNDPEMIEREKHRNLSKMQHRTSTPIDNAPGWNEALATASEASVKADHSDYSPAELQKRTVEYLTSRHSPEERVEPTFALYTRDEVEGPLSSAQGFEDQDDHAEEVVKRTVQKETTQVFKKVDPSSTKPVSASAIIS
ncbi:uncharacterized protein EV420DRAFT_1496258 [Desarmillaria tabescens]|uniref:Uncharacterized protein n=1 Tax=Armillaria tabescens TaxID=1929756 RepID=A0AA39NQ28_ARMTA|nr:uncharacterized protein EV420DRAFT_1496258 [Desarmillaria tabescens]KAK0469728.1 hypothetical protein EV420DRAFT_1496258 [Desarmillaria tabescens]